MFDYCVFKLILRSPTLTISDESLKILFYIKFE